MSEVSEVFVTHTGLIIEQKSNRVLIYSPHEPERAKVLVESDKAEVLKAEYDKWVQHYEQRAKVEVPTA